MELSWPICDEGDALGWAGWLAAKPRNQETNTAISSLYFLRHDVTRLKDVISLVTTAIGGSTATTFKMS